MQVVWLVIRLFAALAGAVVGWLVTGLVVRVLVRLAFQRPAPRLVEFLARIVGAVIIGLLVYYYLHPGGSGGWGLGGGGLGLGGGGIGPGTSGTGLSTTARATTNKAGTAKTTTRAPSPDTLTIALLGGSRYPGEGRYYLIGGKEPARTLDEVAAYLKNNPERYRRVEIVLYPDSVAGAHPATTRLQELVERQGLLLSVTRAAR
jgi:hypothetical protein